MQIERRYTKENQSPYAEIPFRSADERDQKSRRLDRVQARQHGSARALVAGRDRRDRAEIFPQGRRARAPPPRRGGNRPLLPLALGRGRSAAAGVAEGKAHRRRDVGEASVRSPRRHLDLLGLEGRLFRNGSGRLRLLRRDALHAGHADGGAELAAMVQHRPALGLRHRRSEPGPLLRRSVHRQAREGGERLRASAAARLLHPVGRGRSRQRERDHGSVGARGAPVQIRLGHRLEFLEAPRREREALGRRPLVRPHVHSSRSATARRARSSRAAPRAAPRRWWWSTPITRTSRPMSTGR